MLMFQVLKKTLPISIRTNGFFKTFFYLSQLSLIKVGIRKYIIIKSGVKVYLRNGTSDLPAFRQVFLEGEYSYPFNIKPEYIIDAGANVGLASIYFSLRFPGVKIIAIEPEPGNYKCLCNNTKSFSNITQVMAGLWYEDTLLGICKSEKLGDWGTQLSKSTANRQVECYSIENILTRYQFPRIDIFKIDIEGAEKELFLHAQDLNWLKKTKIVVIEIHEFLINGLTQAILSKVDSQFHFSIDKSGENTILISPNN